MSADAARTLVVDPEPFVADLVARSLRAAGVEVSHATNVEQALARARAESPDVVLLSLALPDRDGALTLLGRLRSDPILSGISVAVVASMQRDPEGLARAMDLGADDYVRKPIEPAELVARVRALLRMRRHVAELQRRTERLAALNTELQMQAVRDPLTGLYNRRYLEQRLASEIERSKRYGQPLCAIVCDVDFFKRVNDTHGHAAGDEVLRAVAQAMRRAVRRGDILARIGGEEFVVIAPATDILGGAALAERVRVAVAAAPVLTTTGSGVHAALRVTASFGLSRFAPDAPGPTDAVALIAAADAALYRAKANGRNRVELHDAA